MLQFCFKKKMLYAAYPPAVFCSSLALQLRSQVLRQILMLYKLRVRRHFLKLSLLSVAVVVFFFFCSDRVFLGHRPGLKVRLNLA